MVRTYSPFNLLLPNNLQHYLEGTKEKRAYAHLRTCVCSAALKSRITSISYDRNNIALYLIHLGQWCPRMYFLIVIVCFAPLSPCHPTLCLCLLSCFGHFSFSLFYLALALALSCCCKDNDSMCHTKKKKKREGDI
jgi:hypothetical protein